MLAVGLMAGTRSLENPESLPKPDAQSSEIPTVEATIAQIGKGWTFGTETVRRERIWLLIK
jgi:hypothetical protein